MEYEQVKPRRGGVGGRAGEWVRRGVALLVAVVGIWWVAIGVMELMACLGVGTQTAGGERVVVSLVMISVGVALVDWARRAHRWAREDSREPGGERQVKRAVWWGIGESVMYGVMVGAVIGAVWASAGLVTAESVGGFLRWVGLVVVFLVVALVMKWVGGRAGERRVRAWRGEG